MSLTEKFDTPASLRDLPASSNFYNNWHDFVESSIAAVSPGENNGAFYNPALTDVDVAGEKIMTWMGFPRRVLLPELRDDKRAAYKAADVLRLNDLHPQDEYFEWYVYRDSKSKKIKKITFITELRSYYQKLWEVDPKAVLKIYRKHVSPAVKESDLTSGGSYDVFNKWNTRHGIVHYTHNINTLSAAIGLAQDLNKIAASDNYEADPPYAKTTTSVDPRVSYDIHMLVRKGLFVTFKEPIGIYITGWDNSGITKPDGRPAPASWWKIKRGRKGMVLRLDYEVPEKEGILVGDLKLGGHRIEFGGQLAEHITVGLGGVAGVRKL